MGRRVKRRKFGAKRRIAVGRALPARGSKSPRVPIRACPDGRVREAAKLLEFELAAALRDQIIELRGSK